MAAPSALDALLALPWIRTSDRLPEWARDSTGRFLVLTAPIVGGTGRLSADLQFAFYRGKCRWEWCGPANFHRTELITGRVVAWLDVTHWDRDALADRLDREAPHG